jgi:uncharacterized protein (DUF433 family)
MFPLIAFTADNVARLTKLSVRQIHYWDRTGFFTPSLADEKRRRPYSRIYSFPDVVGLRAIAQLRAAGVSLQELRKVRALFALGANQDWANRRFYVIGKRVFFTFEDAIVAARPMGQSAEPIVLEMGPVVADVQQAIKQLPIRTPEQIGKITRDRWIMSGAPILEGTRIPTETVMWFYRRGYPFEQILEEFPRLTRKDVMAAIDFETARGARTIESPRAAG